MKVEDLRVGDIVHATVAMNRLTPPMRVVGVGEACGGYVYLEIDKEQGDPFEHSPKEIKGVPLSVDFLLKNDFVDNNLGQYYCRVNNVKTIRCGELHPNQWLITIDEVVGDNEYETHAINLKARYVHELQHLVNDCKLTKEFKI